MTDDVDEEEPLEDRMELLQRRAQNLLDVLRDGDEIYVARADGELQVGEVYRSQIERKYPKLFGRMLALEQQMHSGLFPYFLGLLAFTIFLIGLQLNWWIDLLGGGLCDMLNRWWFYLTAPPSVLYLVYLVCGRWAGLMYRRGRDDLTDLIAAEGLDRDDLIVMLRDDTTLDWVVYFLKLDRGPFPVK